MYAYGCILTPNSDVNDSTVKSGDDYPDGMTNSADPDQTALGAV